MRGDLSIDFAVGTALFIFAFVAAYAYINYEYGARMSHEADESSRIRIAAVAENLPRETIEKRIVIAEGKSENEFINLSGYEAKLVLDNNGEPVCFDHNLGGFVANVSGRAEFYIYSASADSDIPVRSCSVNPKAANDWIQEKVSSPVYLSVFTKAPQTNSSGSYCEKLLLNYLSDLGFEEEYLNVCA